MVLTRRGNSAGGDSPRPSQEPLFHRRQRALQCCQEPVPAGETQALGSHHGAARAGEDATQPAAVGLAPSRKVSHQEGHLVSPPVRGFHGRGSVCSERWATIQSTPALAGHSARTAFPPDPRGIPASPPQADDAPAVLRAPL